LVIVSRQSTLRALRAIMPRHIGQATITNTIRPTLPSRTHDAGLRKNGLIKF
jgi:hypothetical protein